jgi:hypothetical protein
VFRLVKSDPEKVFPDVSYPATSSYPESDTINFSGCQKIHAK